MNHSARVEMDTVRVEIRDNNGSGGRGVSVAGSFVTDDLLARFLRSVSRLPSWISWDNRISE